MARLAVARLWFCSNSFAARRTRAEDLTDDAWDDRTARAPDRLVADTELEGLRDFLTTHPGWDVTMLRCAAAPSGGPLSAEVFGNWVADVEEGLRRGRFDAVYFSLHGACQAEGDPTADLTILRRVRAVIGHTPLVASFDVRANQSEEIAILLDGATCNEQWPSGGGANAAWRALSLLDGIVSGRFRPVGALARVPFVLPDLLMGDTISEIWNGVLKTMPPLALAASVFAGFAWGDGPYTGSSALVWADRDAGVARELAARLAMELVRARGRSMPTLIMPEAAIAAIGSNDTNPLPTLMIDLGDDPALGGLADTSAMLLALVSGRFSGRALLAALYDPDAVAEAYSAGVGGAVSRHLCGRFTRIYGNSVPVDATVQGLGEATRYAVLRIQNVDVLLTDDRPVSITPVWLAVRGVDIAAFSVIAIKAGVHALSAFGAAVGRTILCDCPGPTTPSLLRLKFHYVPAIRRTAAGDARLQADNDVGDASGLHSALFCPQLDQMGAD